MPVWSGFWGAGYAPLVNRNPRREPIRRTVNRESFRTSTHLFNALIGAAPGGAVNASRKQVFRPSGPAESLANPVKTISIINRNTNAADVNNLKEMVWNVRTAPNYPRDRSGNGGKAFNP